MDHKSSIFGSGTYLIYVCACVRAWLRASTFGSVGCVAVKSWRVQLSVNVERVGV